MADNRYPRKPEFQPAMKSPEGKLPPHDTELEEVVLGALMLEKDAYMSVADFLTPDAFYDPRNAKIYDAISTLGFNQRPIDMITVTEQLRVNGTLGRQRGVPRQDRVAEIPGATSHQVRLAGVDRRLRRSQ